MVFFIRILILALQFLLIPGGEAAVGIKQMISCYGEDVATYTQIPRKRNGVFILFVPASGYMDAAGKFSATSAGVFSQWQNEALKLGFSVVSFDKPGTGFSSGYLSEREEETLTCVHSNLPKLSRYYNNKLLLLTYGGGIDFIRYSLKKMSKNRRGEKLYGIIQLVGMVDTDFRIKKTIIPYLSLLGDTTLITGLLKKALLHKKLAADTLSRYFVMDNVKINLCPDEQLECKLDQQILDVVFNWVHARARKGYVWKDLDEATDKSEISDLGNSNDSIPNFQNIDRSLKTVFGKIRIPKKKKPKTRPKTKSSKIDLNKRKAVELNKKNSTVPDTTGDSPHKEK